MNTDSNEQGITGLPCGSVFDAATTEQKAQLGRVVSFGDGRKFRQVLAGATLVPGEVVSAPQPTALLANLLAVAAIGAKTVVLTLADITANQFADGTLHLTDDTGEGHVYKIRSNTASDATISIELYEGLQVAIDATTDCIIVPNPYRSVVNGIAAARAVGVAVVAAVDGQYCWVQIAGPASVKVTTTTGILIGGAVSAGASASVILHTAAFPIIGYVIGAVDGHTPVDLCIG